jgi:hypothetical protein
MKTLLWLGLLLSFKAQAENYYSPLLCPVAEAYLFVTNSSNEPAPMWFQDIGSSPFREKYYEMKAHESRLINLSDDFTDESSAFAVKTQTSALKFSTLCKKSGQHWSLDSKSSPWKSVKLSGEAQTLQLHLVNLSQSENPIEIRWQSASGDAQSLTLKLTADFALKTVPVVIPAGFDRLEVRGDGRLLVKSFVGSTEIVFNEEVRVLPDAPATRYFLFRSQDQGSTESFVVPMSDAKLIQQSLDQIANPATARLFVARIDKSLDGTNRDLLNPSKTPWSWTVVQAQNYADFARISCDGTPSVVEERLQDWLTNTGGTICFWNYRVVREVTASEITQSPLSSRPGRESLPRKH